MRIAFLGAEGVPYPNAFARITEEIGWRLVERGHEVVVYCRPRFVAERGRYRGMTRIHVPSWNTKHLDTLTFTFLSTVDLVMHKRADVAHYHGTGPAPLAVLTRLRGIRSVVHIHDLVWQRAKWGRLAQRYLLWAEHVALRWPDAVVAVSRALKSDLEARYGRTVHYVPQGVEPFSERPPEELKDLGLMPREYILYLGRLVPDKGCHYLLQAYSQLRPDVPLVVAGGSAHTDEYEHSLRVRAGPGVRFLGRVEESLKEELLTHALVYVQPSDVEGLSLSLLEAMSAGTCVLVSDIPASLEAIEGHGVTFRRGDSTDLADKLGALLVNREITRTLGRRGRDHVRRSYDWDRVTDAFEALYQSLLTYETLPRSGSSQ